MSGWRLEAFGGLTLRDASGEIVAVSARKGLAALVFLALQPDQRTSRERLAAALWGDVPEAQARANLRQTLSVLRRELGEDMPIEAGGDTVSLSRDAIVTDVGEFSEAAKKATMPALEQAVSLYRGDLLEGFSLRGAPIFEEWASAERQRLRSLALAALDSLLAHMSSAGRRDEVARFAARLIQLDPLREEAHRALMRLHAGQGRYAAALKQYETLRELLDRELGVVPEPATQALYREIRTNRQAVGKPAAVASPNVDAEDDRTHGDLAGEAEHHAVDSAPLPDAERTPRDAVSGVGPRRPILFAAAALAALVGVSSWWMVGSRATEAPLRVARLSPITREQGREMYPALSPDGGQVVYSARAGGSGPYHLFFRSTAGGDALQLTAGPASELAAAWAPGGDSLAFVRKHPDGPCRILVMTVPGGAERVVGQCLNASTAALAWWPDGRSLVVAETPEAGLPSGLYRLDLTTQQRTTLTRPPADVWGDGLPAVSPDGRHLAFSRVRDWTVHDLFLLDLETGRERRLTEDGAWIGGIAWTGGGSLAFSSARAGDIGLWSLDDLDGAAPRRLSDGLQKIGSLSAARSGRRVVVESIRNQTNLYRWSRGRPPVAVEALRGQVSDRAPDVSPLDGAIAFISDRSGGEEVWVAAADGSGPRRLTSLGGYPNEVRWSPDGRRLLITAAVRGQSDVYVVDRDGGSLRRLTNDAADDHSPAWSADGRFAYFTSFAQGRWGVRRASVDGHPSVAIVFDLAAKAIRLSPGGRWLYYIPPGRASIWRRPLAGGRDQMLVASIDVDDWMNWAVDDFGVTYLKRLPSGSQIRRFDVGRRLDLAHADPADIFPAGGMTSDRQGGVLAPRLDSYEIDLTRLDLAAE